MNSGEAIYKTYYKTANKAVALNMIDQSSIPTRAEPEDNSEFCHRGPKLNK